MPLTIAICIATHNRCAELRRTLGVLARLDPAPDEILIAVDGCQDGTEEMLAHEHPGIRTLLHATARGSIPSRNALAAACRSDVIVSLDDDSYPLDPAFIAGVRALFATHPRLAVASFPQRTDEFPETLEAADFGPAQYVGSFANSAAALRRETFLALGAYPDFFFHMYEEPDLALRCTAAGWQVRSEPSQIIRHHYTGTGRNELRVHQRHARNELWSVWMRCPAPQLFAVMLFRVWRQFRYALGRGWSWAVREPHWWAAAWAGRAECRRQRAPLPWRAYLAWMRLQRTPLSEAGWAARFGGARPPAP